MAKFVIVDEYTSKDVMLVEAESEQDILNKKYTEIGENVSKSQHVRKILPYEEKPVDAV